MTGKEITLGDWLKGLLDAGQYIAMTMTGDGFRAVVEDAGRIVLGTGPLPTPEDALQALCEAYHRDEDALLDLDRSAKWRAAHGPDGVAGLCDGEAGIVVCRDGALHLVEKLPYPDSGYVRMGVPFKSPDGDIAIVEFSDQPWLVANPDSDATTAANVRPIETSLEDESELDSTEPSPAEYLKASLESLLAAYMNFPAGSPGEDTLRNHLLKGLVEAVAYLLDQHDAKERT
jgi:hypothetical protein